MFPGDTIFATGTGMRLLPIPTEGIVSTSPLACCTEKLGTHQGFDGLDLVDCVLSSGVGVTVRDGVGVGVGGLGMGVARGVDVASGVGVLSVGVTVGGVGDGGGV